MAALPKQLPDDLQTPGEAIRRYLASHKSAIGRMLASTFELKTMEEAQKLATMLANNYPVPERVSTGIWELISNGVEHGNLEIDFNEKAELLRSGEYLDEIGRRLADPRFGARVVTVDFKRTKTRIRLHVVDEGPGFDFRKYTENWTPPEGPNGRGILIAQQCSFDKVTYFGRGNEVEAIIRL